MKNYYEILEVHPRASKEVIEKAYRVLAKKYHPDLYSGDKKIYAEQRIRDINEAYKILSDDFLKEQYDIELEKEKQDQVHNYQSQNSIKKQQVEKSEKNQREKTKDKQTQEKKYGVGTFMSLIDLVKITFSNLPKREKRKIKREDLIAAGLTAVIIVILIVILWCIPATNGFVKDLLPFLK